MFRAKDIFHEIFFYMKQRKISTLNVLIIYIDSLIYIIFTVH